MAVSTPKPTPVVNHSNSPTLSATSVSSYDLVSIRSLSDSIVLQPLHSTADDSDDEIVWSLASDSVSSSINLPSNDDTVASDDEFVVLSHPNSPMVSQAGLSTPDDEEVYELYTPVASASLENQMNALSLATKKATKKARKAKDIAKSRTSLTAPHKERKKKAAAAAVTQSASSAYPSPAPSPKAGKKKSATPASSVAETSLIAYTGLGSRAIVDDLSDHQSVISCGNESVETPTLYEEASSFISSFLSNPDAKNDTVYRLTLLQSIIIELGLATASLPRSLKAAKAFLKSRVFLNIREYIAVRGQGPEALRRALYPSKSALIKDIRRNPTSLKWVKQHGLQVLLVGWMQH